MWLYKDKVIEKIEDFGTPAPYGFIYVITNKETGKFYIGKKQLISRTNVKLNKKEIASLPTQRGRKATKKLVVKEADWQNYWGSNKPLLEEIKTIGKDKYLREILILCPNSKLLTFWEVSYQIKKDVLMVDSYNENISGKYYKADFL